MEFEAFQNTGYFPSRRNKKKRPKPLPTYLFASAFYPYNEPYPRPLQASLSIQHLKYSLTNIIIPAPWHFRIISILTPNAFPDISALILFILMISALPDMPPSPPRCGGPSHIAALKWRFPVLLADKQIMDKNLRKNWQTNVS